MQENEQIEIIRDEVAPVVSQAAGMAVATADQYAAAAEFLKAVKGAQKRVTDHFGPMKRAAHAAWKTITAKEAEVLAPLTDAERAVKGRMRDYYVEQERIRQAEQRRLQAEADARAETERKRLEAQAAKLKTPELREQRIEQAAAVVAPAVVLAPSAPKVAGQSYRKVWRARVTDPRNAVMRLLDLPDWQAYITINQGELDRLAGRTKGAVSLSGIVFTEETILASRGI